MSRHPVLDAAFLTAGVTFLFFPLAQAAYALVVGS